MTREINSPSNFMNSLMVTSAVRAIPFKSIASYSAKLIDTVGHGFDACAIIPKSLAYALNIIAHFEDSIANFIRPQTDVYYHKMVDNLKTTSHTNDAISDSWKAETLFTDSLKHISTGVPSVWYLKTLPKMTELTPLQYNYGYKIKDAAAFKNSAYIGRKEGEYLIGPKAFYATEEDFVRAALHNEISDKWEHVSGGIIDSVCSTAAYLYTLSGKVFYSGSFIVSIPSVVFETEGQILHHWADKIGSFFEEGNASDVPLLADNAWWH